MTDAEKKSASIRLAQGDAPRARKREGGRREKKGQNGAGEKKPSVRSRGPPRCKLILYLTRPARIPSLRARLLKPVEQRAAFVNRSAHKCCRASMAREILRFRKFINLPLRARCRV